MRVSEKKPPDTAQTHPLLSATHSGLGWLVWRWVSHSGPANGSFLWDSWTWDFRELVGSRWRLIKLSE